MKTSRPNDYECIITENKINNLFNFKRGNISISGFLPHPDKPSASCIVAYETETEYYGLNLTTDHFERFLKEPIKEVLNAIPLLNNSNVIFIRYQTFFGYFSREDFDTILLGLELYTSNYNRFKIEAN